ncbi:MAG TPA: hypothetical protein VGG75_42320 [Trebonia sp.]
MAAGGLVDVVGLVGVVLGDAGGVVDVEEPVEVEEPPEEAGDVEPTVGVGVGVGVAEAVGDAVAEGLGDAVPVVSDGLAPDSM